MPAQWRRWTLRDIALFVAIVAIVAVVGVVIGREAGIGQQTGASVAPVPADEAASVPQQQSEETAALTLTLSAPEICETKRGEGFAGQAWVYDDEGEIIGARTIHKGWANVAETPVIWKVTGGMGPYTLTIDNETRDGIGPYEGAAGTASVSCAPNPGEVSYNNYDQHRWYHTNPEIDSGPKMIHATVTDVTGSAASATTTTYIILILDGSGHTLTGNVQQHQLNSGKTYRYNGLLFTVPPDLTLLAGASWEGRGSFGQELHIAGTNITLTISHSGKELYRVFGDTFLEPQPNSDALKGQDATAESVLSAEELVLNNRLNDFLASLGDLPDSQ